jgi:threonine dehydrogenase-like Zn-dependent dehydrogenase
MTAAAKRAVDGMVERGEIGGRTVQIIDTGAVECVEYPVADVPDGSVRIATVRSAISPGTEMTFYGRDASNVYLHKRWDEDLRLFVAGPPSMDYPLTFGYRSAGEVVESRDSRVTVGQRVYGNWRHTEYTVMPGERALAQVLPVGLTWDDGVDIGQMGPICVNAVAYGEGRHANEPAVVFGAGPVGLITSQIVRSTGAENVVVVDRIPARLAIAASLGLETLDAGETDDVAADLKRRFGSEGVAVAWECTGSAAALHESIRVVRRRGTVVAAGFYQGGASPLMLGDEFHHNGVRVTSGQIGNVHPSHTWPTLRRRTIELCLADSIRLGTLPRTTVLVDEVASGFEALRRPAETLQVALSYGRQAS